MLNKAMEHHNVLPPKKTADRRRMTQTLAYLTGLATIFALVLLGWSVSKDFEAATVEEIQAIAAQSSCSKKLLSDANRNATEIRRRDLASVQAKCVSIDKQAKAF